MASHDDVDMITRLALELALFFDVKYFKETALRG